MATREGIELDFEKAMAQVAELNEIASGLKRVGSDSMGECMQLINASWKGVNSTAYIAKGERLQGKILDSAGDVAQTANTVKDMAERIREAEMRALEKLTNICK